LDILHFHTPLIKRSKVDLPSLVTVHTPMKADVGAIPISNLFTLLIKLQAPISFSLEQELFEHAGKLCVVAKSVADELQQYGISPKNVEIIGNGVDTDIFNPGHVDLDRSKPYFFTAGRLSYRKGLEDLLQCAVIVIRRFPNVRFMIAGSGPLETYLKKEIVKLNLKDHVILVGHISEQKKMIDLYQRASAYIHAAHYEGLPTVLLEAMACGRPVISTAVSGSLDVLTNEYNGLLIPPKNPALMAEAIERILLNPDFAESLGKTAYLTIKERFSWHVVGTNYITAYKKLLSAKSQ
jgi:glycosyltransferase involved in cell wall biosynthesis